MGSGDEIMGTGIARAARLSLPRPPGWKVGFGDGHKIRWSHWAPDMFANNPHIAKPGEEQAVSLWIPHFKGSRLYNKQAGTKWVWNYDFQVTPGEFFFADIEREIASAAPVREPFVVMEPNLPWHKPVAINKDWGAENYSKVALGLRRLGWNVVQFKHEHTRRILQGAQLIATGNFRKAIAVLARASLYIGPEGGLHHAAAAVNVKAVVIFGGFIPPAVVGYGSHINLVGNSSEACGNTTPCAHCRSALDSIESSDVIEWAKWGLHGHGNHMAVGK